MLASFSKLFDKAFVIGFLLPVILVLIAFAWLFPDLSILAPLRAIEVREDALGRLTYVILLAYGLAIILTMTNRLQYRLLEGYELPGSWLRKARQRHEEKRAALFAEEAALTAKRTANKGVLPDDERQRLRAVAQQLVVDYPPMDQGVLPTRFGNVIRAFEAYPLRTYGADGVPTWLRLASVIPKEFAAEVEDARSQVNVLLNLLYLTPLVTVGALWQTCAQTPWRPLLHAAIHGQLAGWQLLIQPWIGLGALAAIPGLYLWVVSRARAWGEVVKAAFDCYLPALITQLGYAAPTTPAESSALWKELNRLFTYARPVIPANVRLAGVPPPSPPRDDGPLAELLRRILRHEP